ncbi:hypothetical protein Pmani_005507 [Petrolisthes manimaculis]|uniref:Uncharacterized protein n=1 Tax=Petrolisthes manimaculis TaxID=1843537 RepID=A0AAE1QC06_9EUCA|nr:hypothetical protein Pmani_020939 [Petrolisthes manimaculis]KAK4311236.1 hypothetical protein Pmani_017251 [Petrolisthes manimaculis]KAK4323806.1 hypothetical protein Pmani_005507 [Petrolisthes manimaculis]
MISLSSTEERHKKIKYDRDCYGESVVWRQACNRCHCYQNHSRCTDDVCSKGDEMDNEKKKPHHHHLKSIYFRKSFKLPFGHEPNRSRKPETRTLGGR